MKNKKSFMDIMRKLAGDGSKVSLGARLKKRILAAGLVGALGAGLIGTAAYYNIATRTMVEKTNDYVMGADYVEWMKAQIEDVTYDAIEDYATGNDGDGTLTGYLNTKDVEGIAELVLQGVDKRYQETGEAFSEGQRDQMERIVKSEINNSIETALTELMDQNVKALTEKTYKYVAAYVSDHMKDAIEEANKTAALADSAGKKAAENAKEITQINNRTGANEKEIASINSKGASYEKELSSLGNKAASNEKEIAGANSKIAANEKELSSVSSRVGSFEKEITAISDRVGSQERELTSVSGRVGTNERELSNVSNRMGTNERELSSVSSRVTENEKELETVSSIVSANEKASAENAANVALLQTETMTHKEALSSLKDDFEEGKQRVQSLWTKTEKNAEDVTALALKAEQAGAKAEEAETRLQNQARDLEALRSDTDKTVRDLASIRLLMEGQEDSLLEFQEMLEKRIAELPDHAAAMKEQSENLSRIDQKSKENAAAILGQGESIQTLKARMDENSLTFSQYTLDMETNFETLAARVKALEDNSGTSTAPLLDSIYPVGSVYISVTEGNPGLTLGGTWESMGAGRTLVGAGAWTDGNGLEQSFTAGTSGGEYQHMMSLEELPSHSHSAEDYYSGSLEVNSVYTDYLQLASGQRLVRNAVLSPTNPASMTHETATAGSGRPMNVMQPYYVVHIWKRVG